MDGEQARYATLPTRPTLFLRTFLPWQAWRFIVINIKMIDIIKRSHRSNLSTASSEPRSSSTPVQSPRVHPR